MGATDFITYHPGADLQAAYREAVSEAVSEYGHDPYNGTISTTDGAYKAVSVPLTRDGAALYAHAHIDDAQKWGPALAVPVADVKDFTLTKVRFTVTLEEGDDDSWSPRHALELKARNTALREHGSAVHTVEVKERVKTKVVTTAAAGKPVSKWQAGAHRLFDTKREAVAEARRLAGQNGGAVSVKQVKVWPESTFRDKTAAVEVSVQTTQATADVTVTLARPKATVVPVTGWLFFGLAAC